MKINTRSVAIVTLTFVVLALSERAGVVIPRPDGGYPGFNAAEGDSALLNLGSGVANTAVGWFSISSDIDGSFNTGVGAGTLILNTGDKNTATGL
jgi:hypothetical protein